MRKYLLILAFVPGLSWATQFNACTGCIDYGVSTTTSAVTSYVAVPSSGIAFGSALNTITSDTNTLNYNSTTFVLKVGSTTTSGFGPSINGGLGIYTSLNAATPLVVNNWGSATTRFVPFQSLIPTDYFFGTSHLYKIEHDTSDRLLTTIGQTIVGPATSGVFAWQGLAQTDPFFEVGHSSFNVDVPLVTNLGVTQSAQNYWAARFGSGGTFGVSVSTNGFTSLTSSATVTGSGGLGVTYGVVAGSATLTQVTVNGPSLFQNATFYTTTPSLNTLVVMSTNNVQAFAVSNSSVTAGDFALSVSSSNPGVMLIGINTYGQIVSSGTTPAVSSCGATPNGSVAGTDHSGVISVGGGVVTSCILTPQNACVNNNLVCMVGDNSASIAAAVTAASKTSVTITTSATLGGGLIYYTCECPKG